MAFKDTNVYLFLPVYTGSSSIGRPPAGALLQTSSWPTSFQRPRSPSSSHPFHLLPLWLPRYCFFSCEKNDNRRREIIPLTVITQHSTSHFETLSSGDCGNPPGREGCLYLYQLPLVFSVGYAAEVYVGKQLNQGECCPRTINLNSPISPCPHSTIKIE